MLESFFRMMDNIQVFITYRDFIRQQYVFLPLLGLAAEDYFFNFPCPKIAHTRLKYSINCVETINVLYTSIIMSKARLAFVS